MADTPLSESEARHLLRRTGFGAPQAQVEKLTGQLRSEAVDDLLKFNPQGFRPNGKFFEDQHDKWVKFMLKTKHALQEKLVLFWHDHFATGISKVQDTRLMGTQNRLFRKNCKGNFKDLVKAVNRDPAMMEYLDTVRNSKNGLNENYGRELQELFTLGVKDPNGNDNYTQEDIVQIARAFTGWRYDDRGVAYLDEGQHDFRGGTNPKTIYKQTGGFGPAGVTYAGGSSGVDEGPAEIDSVIDVIFRHEYASGRNTVAHRTARRLIEFFGTASPSQTFIDDVVGTGADAFPATWDVSGALRRLFLHDEFYAGAGAPATTGGKSVRWPIDYVVTTLRLLKVKLKGKELTVNGGNGARILDHLENMGQVLLDPPSVFGWDWETNWISSATLLARYSFARDVTSARGSGGTAFRPDAMVDLTLTDPLDIVEAVLAVCGMKDQLTGAEKDVLVDYLLDGITPPIDLADYDVRNEKLNGLFALVLQSPAYQLI